jgi:dihydroorotase
LKVLIKKAIIHQPGSDDDSRRDILIEDGVITNMAKSISDGNATIIESGNLHVSPGWLDIGAQPGQPGHEYRETFESIARCARAGGYTALATFPQNLPPIHSRVEVEYITKLSASLPIRVYPIGAVSHNLEGKDLTEMVDMNRAGAVAFSDGRKNPIESGLLTRALEYVIPFNGTIIDFPLDRSLTSEGQMHEGKFSASLGLTGIPVVGEDIIVQRDLKLLAYSGGRLHLHAVSSGQALGYVAKARNEKMNISCDVSAMHLFLEDRDVADFDSHKKVLPPFRDSKERKALLKAVRDGIVDHISSIHTPREVESKDCEFTYASFGSLGLESAFAAANTALREIMPLYEIALKFYEGPRRVLNLPIPAIQRNAMAELTLFDPDIQWTYGGSKHSLSANDALQGRAFIGRVIATVAHGQVVIN